MGPGARTAAAALTRHNSAGLRSSYFSALTASEPAATCVPLGSKAQPFPFLPNSGNPKEKAEMNHFMGALKKETLKITRF